MAKSSFTEISNAKISEKRDAVISRLNDGSYTIGQRLKFEEEGKGSVSVFLKGALHASNLEGLQNLRDAINLAIKLETKRTKK